MRKKHLLVNVTGRERRLSALLRDYGSRFNRIEIKLTDVDAVRIGDWIADVEERGPSPVELELQRLEVLRLRRAVEAQEVALAAARIEAERAESMPRRMWWWLIGFAALEQVLSLLGAM